MSRDPRKAESPETQGIEIERPQGDVSLLHVSGEWDLTNVAELRRTLDEAFETSHAVVLDLDQTRFVDSSVLLALATARQRTLSEDKVFVIRLGSEAFVRNALRVAGLLRVLPVTNDLEAALQFASSPHLTLE